MIDSNKRLNALVTFKTLSFTMKISSNYSLLLLISCSFLCSTCKVKSSNLEKKTLFSDQNKPTNSIINDQEEQEYASDNYLRYTDFNYKPNIQTTQLFVKDDPLSYPVIFLGTNQQLELHFDDLKSEFDNYNYTFVHCNADWQPSNLLPSEYMKGFFNGIIQDYEYSTNTLYSYIHYSVSFPNEDIQFLSSGNYLLKVYGDNEEDLLLTRRFHIVEKRVSIDANIHMATLARYRDYKQELDFSINYTNYPIENPYSNIQVVLRQNRRWDNAITGLKPQFIRENELVYNYEDNNLFDGNNEYRFFDAKDLRYQALNVDGIQIMDGKTHLFVLPEEPRSFKRYYFQQDLNGNRFITRENSSSSNWDADYMLTHFTLKRETEVPGGDIYVFGALSDWDFKEEFKMKYVEVNSQYELTTKLKQGYYNYNYIYLPKGSTTGDMSVIEGTHSETNNEYYFFVYYRENGGISDRLIGFEIKNSNNN